MIHLIILINIIQNNTYLMILNTSDLSGVRKGRVLPPLTKNTFFSILHNDLWLILD